VDYSPKSYIGLRRGRRVWAPLWFRRDGATVYLPDPDGSRAEEPSVAMESFRERLHDEGLEAAWQRTYNAGSNPISMRLRRSDLDKPVVQELLRATHKAEEVFQQRDRLAAESSGLDEIRPGSLGDGCGGLRDWRQPDALYVVGNHVVDD
jgi:uncharacterized protein (DUF736 family)